MGPDASSEAPNLRRESELKLLLSTEESTGNSTEGTLQFLILYFYLEII